METMEELDQMGITHLYGETGLWFHFKGASGGMCGVKIEDISFEMPYLNIPIWNVENLGDMIFTETTRSWVEVIGGLCA
jgi:hypothetical protein